MGADEANGDVVGRVAGLWRYPVKSMQGEALEATDLVPSGVPGDRVFGLLGAGGHVLAAKTVPDLLFAAATTGADGRVTVELPDGTTLHPGDDGVDDACSAWLGRPVRLAAAGDTGDVAYEMTFDPPDDSAELVAIPTPSGTLLDWAPLHVLTTASLAAMAAQRPEIDWDVRRFRPNLLLDVPGEAFIEDTWVGRRLAVGGATLEVREPTVRCAMPLRAQPGGLARDVEVFRALDAAHANFLGVYVHVATPGRVTVGDEVTLLA